LSVFLSFPKRQKYPSMDTGSVRTDTPSLLESSHRYLLECKFRDPASARQPPTLRFGSQSQSSPD
jgi:hypothetical protein